MAKRRREEAYSNDGAAIIAPPATLYNAVFIDTNLDTHLAMMASDVDTISDLRKKIMFEHLQCFPEMGEIKIHSVKVKRKGNFYHLPDSMLVKTAFEGVQRNWFLYVSGSISENHISNKTCDTHDGNNQEGLLCVKYDAQDVPDYVIPDDPSKASTPRDMGMDIRQWKDERCGDLSSDTGGRSSQKKIVSRSIDEEKRVTTLSHELKDVKSRDSSKGKPLEGPLAKRQKLKHGEDAPHRPALEGSNANASANDNDNEGVPVHIKVKGKSGAGRKHRSETGAEVSSLRNNKANNKDKIFTEGAESGVAAAQNEGSFENTLNSNVIQGIFGTRIHEDSMKLKQETLVVGPNTLRESLEDVHFRSDSESRESKRKAKKALSSSADLGNEITSSRKSPFANSKDCPPPVIEENQTMDTSICHPSHGSPVADSPSLKADHANITEEQDLLPNNYVETVYSPNSMPSDQGKQVTSLENLLPSSHLSDAKGVAGHDNKWKKKKKSNARIQQELEMKPDEPNSNTSISLLNFTTYHATDDIRKDESSTPMNESDKVNNESTVPTIEEDLTKKVGNESKVSETGDLEMTASEICPPSDHVQADRSAKGGTEHGNRHKKKKSKECSARIQFERDIVNTDQATILEFSTDDYENDDTRINEIKVPQIEADQHNMIEKEGKLSETGDPDKKIPEMCQPSHHGNDETAVLSSKLDAIRSTEGGNTGRTKRKRKSTKNTAGKTRYKLEKADVNDLVSGISSAAVNAEFCEPVTDETAKTEGLITHTQAGQTTNTMKKGESSAKNVDIQSATCVSPVCGKADMTSEQPETVSRAQPSNANATGNHENTGASRKKRQSKKSLVTNQDSSVSPANVALGVSSGLPTVDLSIDGSKKDQSLLHCTEIKDASRQGPIDTSASGSQIEIDKVNESEAENLPVKRGLNEVGPLQVIQTGKSHLDEENTEKKAKRKTKRNSRTTGQSHSNLAKNDHEVGVEELVASNDNMLVVHHPPNATEVSGIAKDDHFAPVAVTDVQLESLVNNGHAHGNPKDNSEAQLQPEVSTDNAEAINFRRCFVPGAQQDLGASSDKVKKAVKLSRETKAGKKSAKVTVPLTSRGLVSSLAQDEIVNPEYKRNSSTKLGKSKHDKQDKVKLQSKQNSVKVAETEIKAPSYSKDRNDTLQEIGNPVVNVFENNKSFDESSSTSSPSSSQIFLQSKKDISQSGSNRKSLASKQVTNMITGVITAPSAALRDDKYGDENGAGISDASTRTPSNDSSSSGSSVDGSELSHHSTRNGANGAKRENSHGKCNLKSNLSSAKNLSIGEILRSSRQFKKAKQTAAQLHQLETESQPVDFVPESEPQ